MLESLWKNHAHAKLEKASLRTSNARMSSAPPLVLSIAGSDCSCGAGLQADLKTFQHFGLYGLTAVTCVVAETANEVRSIHPIPPQILRDQLEVMLGSLPIAAIKTGMLFSHSHISAVVDVLRRHPHIPLVVDPVMIASTGDSLLEPDAVEAYQRELFPLAKLITPNLDEAEVLWGDKARSEEKMGLAALELAARHSTSVLLKGGHLQQEVCTDVLAEEGDLTWFRAARIHSKASHGTGCTLSAAIASQLALGHSLTNAVQIAKDYLGRSISESFTWGRISVLNQGTAFPPV
jgi:hydroxymethylpyrimidine/phosphomethylpyrimidine kinase